MLLKALPESVKYLAVRGGDPREIAAIMARVAPGVVGIPTGSLIAPDPRRAGLPVKYPFVEGRALGPILLWIPFFMNLLMIYFIVSWLPALLRQAAMPVSAGVKAISMFSLAGIIGSVAQGRLMNRYGAYVVMATEFLVSTLLIGSPAFARGSVSFIMTGTLFFGFTLP